MLKPKISLSIPNRPGRYFSLKLKRELSNERSEFERASRILVVSDIGQDFQSFVKLLIRNGVIDTKFNWNFDNGHLVIYGGLFNNDNNLIASLWFIYSLEEKARIDGGYVHLLIGNDAVNTLNGEWRFRHPVYMNHLESSRSFSTALYGGNYELWVWLCTKNQLEKIGNVMFIHGELPKDLIHLKLSVLEVNRRVRANSTNKNQTANISTSSPVLNDNKSLPLHSESYTAILDEKVVDIIHEQFNVDVVVIGHEMLKEMRCFYDGKIINVVTNQTANKMEALLIKNQRFYKVDLRAQRVRIK